MAQNFWLASFAFTVCFVLTLVISLATRRTKTDEELKGLVYSLTPKIKDEEQAWYLRPAVLGMILLALLRHPQHHLLVNERNNIMGLDIRWPIGLMFSLIGVLLAIYGLRHRLGRGDVPALARTSTSTCIWGLVLLVFGAFMLIMAWRGSRNADADKK